ncbi:MAG: LacI family DNA-binding transcriptional regulator, partial [Kiritimatiellae bacterium]|nr:LacI family DNA-binding transcriptional regulator [Kiritimatiellia bacterium]
MTRQRNNNGKSTILDICREAGVSVATASRVLNHSPKVTEETRRKVLAAVAKLGYTPNAAARRLVGKNANALGVIFHQMTSGFYASVMSGIEVEARGRGYHVLITLAHHADPERTRYYDMLDEARVDGLIVLDSTLDATTIERLKTYERPIVLIQKASDDPEIATVCSANEEGACTAMRHLLSLGRGGRLLLVAGPVEAEDSDLRMQGCNRALAEHDLSLEDVDVIVGRYSAVDALEAFREYRDKQGLPAGIFAFNDDMALAIMKELRVTGVKVPAETAVIGFDGIEAADYMGLTTIEMPMMDLGREAVRLL